MIADVVTEDKIVIEALDIDYEFDKDLSFLKVYDDIFPQYPKNVLYSEVYSKLIYIPPMIRFIALLPTGRARYGWGVAMRRWSYPCPLRWISHSWRWVAI